VNYNNKGLKIVEGETPSTHTGRGIGTRLRALITILSTMSGVPVKQFGEWFVARRPGNTNNRPPTTRILRNKLGWKPLLRNNGTNTYRSIFDPKRNNVSLARVVVKKQRWSYGVPLRPTRRPSHNTVLWDRWATSYRSIL